MPVDPAMVVAVADYLTERLNSRIAGLDDKLSARIAAIEDAQDLAHENASRIPTLLMQTETRLTGMIAESKADHKEALKLALNSTRELFKVQTDANVGQIHAVDDKTNLNTNRVAALEVRMGGKDGSQAGSGSAILWIFGAATFVSAVVSTIALIFGLVHH